MDRLKLSIEVFASRLGDYVSSSCNETDGEMTIERFAIYNEKSYMLQSNYLYLCFDGEIPARKHVQPGTNIIFCGCDVDLDDYSSCKCGCLIVEGIEKTALINMVIAIFALFNDICLELKSVPEDENTFSRLVDIGERLFEMPICILDINQNILAHSLRGYDFPNPLWTAVAKDNKPLRCEIISLYADKFTTSLQGSCKVEPSVASIDGFETALYNIFDKGVVAASVWMFKAKAGSHFTVAEIQLFEWFSSVLDGWATKLGSTNNGSGTESERLVLDIVDGVFKDEFYIEEAIASVGGKLCSKAEYQMIILKPGTGVPLASNLKVNKAVQEGIPEAMAGVSGFMSIIMIPAMGSEYPSQQILDTLKKVCQEYHYYGIMGTAFKSLCDAPRVLRQLNSCYQYIDTTRGEPKLHHYCEYIVLQSMQLIVDAEPIETVIHPWIRKLLAYDRNYKTNYLETLKVYLNNRASITEASKQLYMHRNTLQHRINRISELLGDDFEDWETRRILLYSIDFLHFFNNGKI